MAFADFYASEGHSTLSATAQNLDRERFRAYLRLMADLQIDMAFAGKVDLSGVVQMTLLESENVGDDWRSWSDAQRLAWLRTALANNLKDEVRKFTSQGRDVRREVSLDHAIQNSSQRIDRWLADNAPSPSSVFRREENLLRLANALGRLGGEQRRAIECHHLRGMSLADTAEAMGKSRDAVAGLIYRGLVRLKQELDEGGRTR
jgi:RNA polymerase sigma-70 factor (ECF subfamily)